MADVPKDLLEQIKELERLFTVDTTKLKEVMSHFVKELEKGKSDHLHAYQNPALTLSKGLARKAAALSVFRLQRAYNARLTSFTTAHESHLGHGLPRWL